MSIQTKPNIWQRIISAFDTTPPLVSDHRRAAWVDDDGNWQHHDLLSEVLSTPEARRAYRSDSDMLALYGAVYAAIRRRVRAITALNVVLTRRVGSETITIDSHPALDALKRINESMTHRQGMGLIEQHKLTSGKAFWIKRRNRLGVVTEFEIWPPESVEVVPDKVKSWVPIGYKRHLGNGTTETVKPEDVIWFRHVVDPRNPLNGLSPISAVRMQLDTGIEAMRFNQRFFDNSTNIGQIFNATDAEPAEVARIEKDLERKLKGTDKAHRSFVIGGEIKALEARVSHKDMEFLEQQRWTVEEVARVFEMAPELIGSGGRTYENVDYALRDFWEMVLDQAINTIEEFNEFFIHPDFGEEYDLIVQADNISALQENKKLRAEVDEINLRSGKHYINELRDRDGQEQVPWGDLPLLPNNIVPLGSAPPPQPTPPGPPRGYQRASLDDHEQAMLDAWERRLQRELKGIIAHLTKADKRDIGMADVNSYDWEWRDNYGKDVAQELTLTYSTALTEMGFVDTPLLGVQQVAVNYAKARTDALLAESGRFSISATTREGVRNLVAQTIEEGHSLNWLQQQLRDSYLFGKKRAETIARTETAQALGKASLQAFQSQGAEGKRWITARDHLVCAVCQSGADDGAIALPRHFSNGHEGPPPHARCRCKLEPVKEIPRVSSNGHKAVIGL